MISVMAAGRSEAGAKPLSPLEKELSASFQFVESLGESMWLEEVSSQDLAIHFTLPVAGQTTVLAIDDNEGLFRLFERYLAQHRYRLVGVRNGDEGLALAREEQPDVILLDLRLPDADGMRVCHAITDDPRTCNIPVIILSGMERPDIIRRSRAAGCQYFIRKPYDPNALLLLVQSAVGESNSS